MANDTPLKRSNHLREEDDSTNAIENQDSFPPGFNILADDSDTLNLDNYNKLLPIQSNRELILKCFFDLIFSMQERKGCPFLRRWCLFKRLKEIPHAVTIKEVFCALSWHLPLYPLSEILINSNSIHLVFTPSSDIVVKRRLISLDDTVDLIRICCSHVKRIRDNPTSLRRLLQRQQDQACGKEKKSVPDIDKLKKKVFKSWICPVKQVSLLFMREIGEIHLTHI